MPARAMEKFNKRSLNYCLAAPPAPSANHSRFCNSIGTFPFRQTKSSNARKSNFSPAFERASDTNAGDSGYGMLRGNKTTLGTLESVDQARADFVGWYADVWDKDQLHDQSKLEMLQKNFAALAGKLMAEVLLPSWRSTGEGLTPCLRATEEANSEKMKDTQASPALEPLICYAEVFVCYVYLGFIQNVLGRMRTLVMGIVSLFIAITISLACYPFDPRTVVNTVMVLLFLALGTVVVFVYAQMHRDAILSALTNTKPGELDAEFWFKLVGFGAGPVLGLLATIFPELTDFIFSWIQPSMTAIK